MPETQQKPLKIRRRKYGTEIELSDNDGFRDNEVCLWVLPDSPAFLTPKQARRLSDWLAEYAERHNA